MDKVNNVELQVIGDKYHIFVNGVEIKQVSNVQISKTGIGKSKLVIEFEGIIETKWFAYKCLE